MNTSVDTIVSTRLCSIMIVLNAAKHQSCIRHIHELGLLQDRSLVVCARQSESVPAVVPKRELPGNSGLIFSAGSIFFNAGKAEQINTQLLRTKVLIAIYFV
jgi:hypothetical protein